MKNEPTKLKISQTNINWSYTGEALNAAEYNGIWGDGTYWYTCGSVKSPMPPPFSTGWDLMLTKWYSNGTSIWGKSYKGNGGSSDEMGYDVWGDGTYIYTCGETSKDGDKDMVLIKWRTNGTLMWNKTWRVGTGDEVARSVWASESYVFTCGETKPFGVNCDAVLVKWDKTTGNIISTPLVWDIDEGDDWCDSIIGGLGYIYLCGWFWKKSGDCDLFLYKYDYSGFDQGWKWKKNFTGVNNEGGRDVWIDGNYIYSSGFTVQGGKGKDLLLVKWRDEGDWVSDPIWNKTWGGALDDEAYALWGSDNYIYTTGYTSSYYDNLILVKWDNYGNQIWNSTFYRPPNSISACGTGIWGHGNHVYTCGYVLNSIRQLNLIKWNANPEQLYFNLTSPSKNSVYESGTEINIDLINEFVELDKLLYHWDAESDTSWTESTLLQLPSTDMTHTLYLSATTNSPYIKVNQSFTFTTDDTNPIVSIEKPETNEVWAEAPAYDLDIIEPHIDEICYTLNDGPNHTISSEAGTILSSAWNNLSDGSITIKFYVTDILGHMGSDEVAVLKDTKAGQRELEIIIRNTIITATITGVIGIAFFLIKRKIGKGKV